MRTCRDGIRMVAGLLRMRGGGAEETDTGKHTDRCDSDLAAYEMKDLCPGLDGRSANDGV